MRTTGTPGFLILFSSSFTPLFAVHVNLSLAVSKPARRRLAIRTASRLLISLQNPENQPLFPRAQILARDYNQEEQKTAVFAAPNRVVQ